MAAHLHQAGICSSNTFMVEFDDRTQRAKDRWLQALPADMRREAEEVLQEAGNNAAQRWDSWCAGMPHVNHVYQDANAGHEFRRPGMSIIGDVGSEDTERPGNPSHGSALHTQKRLTMIADRCVAQGLHDRWTRDCRWNDIRRLTDLCDRNADHDWLWAVHHKKNRKLEDAEFVAAVRLRLGCGGPEEA
eukprot:1778773-Karenia_brevis.AAC.1